MRTALLFENGIELNYSKNNYLELSEEIYSVELFNKENEVPKLTLLLLPGILSAEFF